MTLRGLGRHKFRRDLATRTTPAPASLQSLRCSSNRSRGVKVMEGIAKFVESNWNSDDKMKKLKRRLQKLMSIETDITIQLENLELSSNKKRKNEVAHWLREVQRVKNEIHCFEAEAGESKWSKLWGKAVDGFIGRVNELIAESRFQGGLVLEACEAKGEALLVTELFGQAFHSNVEKILAWLMKDEAQIVGICGMGGVGKTTLATHIHNHLLRRPDKFHTVYWVTVSQDFSIRKLQDQIAEVIHVDLSDAKDEKKRAAALSRALFKKQKSVFILDDLWDQFNLEQVGLSIGVAGCKMLLTTRSLDICRMMCCQEMIKLEPLLEEESWNLFMEKLGNYEALPGAVKLAAKLVARECAGLPLGIVTMAASMRGVDDVIEWRNVLEELKESNVGPGEMEDKVFNILKFSYVRLRDPMLQQCFLSCALFPEDYEIERDYLVEYLIDDGTIKGLKSRQAQIDKGLSMLNKLENACLLKGVINKSFSRCVKMHDLIRDMALNMLKENGKAMVEAGKNLWKVPHEWKWTQDLQIVSLMENRFGRISWHGSPPSCPNLKTLLLRGNFYLEQIQDDFFYVLPSLAVLDLSHTAIKVLPDSVSDLVSLTALLLNNCRGLYHIPSLAKLKALKKLNLRHSGVKEVPKGFKLLCNLTYLDLYDSKIKDLPAGGLPGFSCLEFLGLQPWLTVKNEEIAGLRKLEVLQGYFHDSCDWNNYFCPGFSVKDREMRLRLSYYDLIIGEYDMHCGVKLLPDLKLAKRIVFYGCNIGMRGDFAVLPQDILELNIFKCRYTRSLCNSLVEGVSELKSLNVCECDGIEFLVSFPSFSSSVLKSLENLTLKMLKNMRVLICREASPSPSRSDGIFSSLKRIQISRCPHMRCLFPSSLLPGLQNLEEIKVGYCEGMEEIITLEEQEREEVRCEESKSSNDHHSFVTSTELSLPKLRLLEFLYLPNLKSFCSGKMNCDSIQKISMCYCLKLKRMPLSLVLLVNGQLSRLPSLEKIEIRPKRWWNSLEWDYPDSKCILEPICDIF